MIYMQIHVCYGVLIAPTATEMLGGLRHDPKGNFEMIDAF